jgi:hypothetical protein
MQADEPTGSPLRVALAWHFSTLDARTVEVRQLVAPDIQSA